MCMGVSIMAIKERYLYWKDIAEYDLKTGKAMLIQVDIYM